jgi:DNA invertase Pin-like site-specific DNA recombinase
VPSNVRSHVAARIDGVEHQKLGLSLDAQAAATRSYAANNQGWIVAGEFQDVMSGRRDDRPQYQEMLTEARHLAAIRARIAVVVVRTDRLGRDVAEAARTRKELTRLGAQIHMIADGGMVGDLPAHIYMAVAQDESNASESASPMCGVTSCRAAGLTGAPRLATDASA